MKRYKWLIAAALLCMCALPLMAYNMMSPQEAVQPIRQLVGQQHYWMTAGSGQKITLPAGGFEIDFCVTGRCSTLVYPPATTLGTAQDHQLYGYGLGASPAVAAAEAFTYPFVALDSIRVKAVDALLVRVWVWRQ